jgi:putative glycosyltransferase (TIGR04348 family)
MGKPRVRIVSPALAAANNGNAHTAARWREFLQGVADVELTLAWHGEPVDALIALHARRSAESVARFRDEQPAAPLTLVLTGTDLYGDLETGNASARHSVECASHLVVLQPQALARLDDAARARTRCILQSAPRRLRDDKPRDTVSFIAVGHLRAEKDPLTLMQAALQLPFDSPIRIVHAGNALDDALADAARRTMASCTHYRWLGGVSADAAREHIAGAHALVHMSRMEGGANVVTEAIRSQVPVLASRIPGNLGLLGDDYEGCFPVGDARALAMLMQRFAADRAFVRRLAGQCALREPFFAPDIERHAVRTLLADMLRGAAATMETPLAPTSADNDTP